MAQGIGTAKSLDWDDLQRRVLKIALQVCCGYNRSFGAEDVCNEVLLKVQGNPQIADTDTSLWLQTRWTFLSMLRHISKEDGEGNLTVEAERKSAEQDPSAGYTARILTGQIMSQLEDDEKRLLVMMKLKHTNEEIGRSFQIGESAVRERRKKLTEKIVRFTSKRKS